MQQSEYRMSPLPSVTQEFLKQNHDSMVKNPAVREHMLQYVLNKRNPTVRINYCTAITPYVSTEEFVSSIIAKVRLNHACICFLTIEVLRKLASPFNN